MRAVRIHRFGGPEVLQLDEVDVPEPGLGEVLLEVRAAAVNPFDTYVRAGALPGVLLPLTPGIEAAGVIVSVGRQVSRWAAGDRVYAHRPLSGSYAEFALYSQEQVFHLPDHLSFEQGAAITVPYSTAYRALFQVARAIAGETVLIHGASGGVGLAAVQLARAAGLRVVGTAGSAEGRRLVAEAGAAVTLDHTSPSHLDGAFERGQGPDVILEMMPASNLNDDLNVLAEGGRLVLVGNRGEIKLDLELTARDLSIWGVGISGLSPAETREIQAAISAGLRDRTLNPVVGSVLALEDAAAAHVEVMAAGRHGRVLLRPGRNEHRRRQEGAENNMAGSGAAFSTTASSNV